MEITSSGTGTNLDLGSDVNISDKLNLVLRFTSGQDELLTDVFTTRVKRARIVSFFSFFGWPARVSPAFYAICVLVGVSKSISEETAIWFHKPSLLHQSIFSIPVLGYLSTLQAIMIFGIGLPLMFAILYVANDSEYAVIPPIVMAVIAMVRPPVMSYEARALAALRFLMGGGVKPKKKTKSRSLAVPSGGKAKTEGSRGGATGCSAGHKRSGN